MTRRVHKNKTWQRALNWFGPVQRRRFMHNAWLEIIVAASLVLVVTAAYGSAHTLILRHRNAQRQPEALVIARTQLKALQASDGLAGGEQCFDESGTPRASSDPGAPCSYTAMGKPGCLSSANAYCYEVRITQSAREPSAAQTEQAVTYSIGVSWSGGSGMSGQVRMGYRVVEPDSMYAANRTGRSGSGGPGNDATIGVANGVVGGVGTTLGGRFINTLADIPGGPSVSVSAASCAGGSGCTIPKNAYDLAGHLMVSTNIPDKLITACTWDFGDGTTPVEISGAKGCFNGQIVNHSYAATWQMRPLPEYPLACASPLGISLNSYAFLVNVTLHTTSGIDIKNSSPQYVVMPGCSAQ